MALTKVTGQVIKNTTDVTVGVLTVTNTLAVGGTVSIGGTLTYEDVTNVDAVGLITARNGIVVGSGITLSKDGDVFFTGIATGNGSGLTALNATQLTSGTVPTARLGSGTASSSTFLRGDSTFAAVTSTTINNNAANRIVTGSGTANTLNANSDLLWNGSRLDIDTGGTEDALRIGSSSGADTFIRLGSTGTTADTHAVLKYDVDDNYVSLLVSGESHGNGGILIANGGAVSLSAGTSPSAKLHVKDDIYVKGSSGDGSVGIQIRSGGSALSNQHQIRTGGGSGDQLFIEALGGSSAIVTKVAGSERLRIDSNGKVHVGLTNGSGQFNVKNQNDSSTNALEIYNDNGVRNASFSQNSSGDATMDLRTNSASQTVLLRSNGISHFSGGDFGLGTASPAYTTALFGGTQRTLHVSGTAAPIVRIQSSTSGQADLILQAGNSAADAYIANAASNGDLVFSTNNGSSQGTRLRILDDGGICFNSDTAAANALDDYEEGTFTPSFGFNLANFNGSYSAQGGRYTKIGNLVSVSMQIDATKGTGTGGTATIYNLPFSAINEDNARGSGSVGFYNGFTCARPIVILVEQNQNQFPLRHSGSSQATSIGASDMASSFRIYISVTYFTA